MPGVAPIATAGDEPAHGSALAGDSPTTTAIGTMTANATSRAPKRRAITKSPRQHRGELDRAPDGAVRRDCRRRCRRSGDGDKRPDRRTVSPPGRGGALDGRPRGHVVILIVVFEHDLDDDSDDAAGAPTARLVSVRAG